MQLADITSGSFRSFHFFFFFFFFLHLHLQHRCCQTCHSRLCQASVISDVSIARCLSLAPCSIFLSFLGGWSGGAMALGKLPVPGRPTILMSRTRACCACSRCGWGLFGHFYSIYPFSPLSPFLWETARYRLKYCLKGPLNPKQPTNQLDHFYRNYSKLYAKM